MLTLRKPVMRLDKISALFDREALGVLVGPIASIERAPLSTVGYSGATHERLTVHLESGQTRQLVLKHTRVALDWVASRTGDSLGREALLLSEAEGLASVWEAFNCPYLAFAIEEGETGLLMDDVSEHLVPDVREPISEVYEDAVLAALARMHASFWNSPVLELPWLARLPHYLDVLSPRPRDDGAIVVHPAILDGMSRGWEKALGLLSPKVVQKLTRPAAELASEWSDLPSTLIHGDVKVANFAFRPDGVVAFDWSLLGAGPATVDLGWYLAVNATRLARPKEVVMARYRQLLEEQLKASFLDTDWERMATAGILCGALMLLWTKALALDSGTTRAHEEWDWWVSRLSTWAEAG